ncbi:molybdopterin-dependent oxidoreductase [Siccirubricoccus deserti]
MARIADMLLNPGGSYEYNGQTLTYPAPKLVYWAGGNPFHHHQDLNRLRRAFRQVETLVVHEIGWTATARHADIVLPVTMTLEREDIGSSQTDPLMVAMHRIAEPYGEARDDYAIFSDLAARLGKAEAFTEGRSAGDWLRHLYAKTEADLITKGLPAPDFDSFWRKGNCCCRRPRMMAAYCAPSVTTPMARRCRPAPAASRSSARPSPVSATPIAPATPPGCRPPRHRGARHRCISSPTSRRRGCIASSTTAATAAA